MVTVVQPSTGLRVALGIGLRAWRTLRRYPVIPALIVIVLVVCAIFAPWLAQHDPRLGNIFDSDRPPTWQATSPVSGKASKPEYILGTDPLGRDILSRIIWGARYSLAIAGTVLFFGAVGGSLLGMVAGYFRGALDEVIMRTVDLTLGVPFILVALASVVVFGASFELVISLLVAYSWSGYPRGQSGDAPNPGDRLRLIGKNHGGERLPHPLSSRAARNRQYSPRARQPAGGPTHTD